MAKPIGFFVGPDKRSGRMPIDENCIPTYEGGDPARYCYPEGRDNDFTKRKALLDEIGWSYDGVEIFNEDYIKASLGVSIHIERIDQRHKNYGRKPDTCPAPEG